MSAMAKLIPPHLQEQAKQVVANQGEWKDQAQATAKSFSEGQGIDDASRNSHMRGMEARQEQQSYDQQKTQTQQPEGMSPDHE